MDSNSRRIAALQKDSADLAAEAMTLKKAMPKNGEKPPRLKEIAVRLNAIESEYSSLLAATPMSAVTCRDEAGVLQSENKELRRRNTELERKVLNLQQFQQQAKENQSVLLQRSAQAEKDLIASKREIKASIKAKQAAPVPVADESFLNHAAQQLNEAAIAVKNMHAETAEKAARIEDRIGTVKNDLAVARRNANDLRREVEMLETTLMKESKRADAAEALVQELRQDVTSISNEVIEVRSHLQTAKEEANDKGTARPEPEGQHAMLRKWAEDELQRLKQQLAATGA